VLRRRTPRPPRTGAPADLLVVGLGNPGDEYRGSRHNVGAEVVELLARRHGGRLHKGKERALVDEVRVGDARVAIAVPLTYMNDSGQAVRPLVRRYGVGPGQLVVVHDELDLPVARLQVKSGVAHLHTDGFHRVRIGVGKPVSKERGADHVLRPFTKRERAEMDVTIEEAADAVEVIIADGVAAAMNRFNEPRAR
jgi:peptidyl-tRNA hydrolase, PTH1 family